MAILTNEGKKEIIRIEGTGLTINTNELHFQLFAQELARAVRRNIDEVNAGMKEEKKRKRLEAGERKRRQQLSKLR